MNGVYWEKNIPRLFEKEDAKENFGYRPLQTSRMTQNGSVPINLGDQSMEDHVYGVDRKTFEKTASVFARHH